MCHQNNCPCCLSDLDPIDNPIFNLEVTKVSNCGPVLSKVQCTSCSASCGKLEGRLATCFCYSFRFLNGIKRHYIKHLCIYYCPNCKENYGERDLIFFKTDLEMIEILDRIQFDSNIDWSDDFESILQKFEPS
jgi:hypothetical protein